MSLHGARDILRRIRAVVRPLVLGVALLGSAMIGMPVVPEQIEEHLRSASDSKFVQMLESKAQSGGDPPSFTGDAIRVEGDE